MTLEELAKAINAQLHPAQPEDAGRVVTGCARLESAGAEEVTFLANPKYKNQLASTDAAAIIVDPNTTCEGKTLLVCDDPYFAFRNAVVALHGFRVHPTQDEAISEHAVVHPTAEVGEGTVVHPFAVISEDAKVGKNCVIYPHTFIGPRAQVGDDCELYANVTVYDDCVLGNRVILHSGCVIGQDGFGHATHAGKHNKIPQSGNAVIEDDVEMGANCAIDRATLGSTVIGEGSKFSDLIAIGHGTTIGKHNLLVALVGVAGSVETGQYVVMGGQVGIAGHLKIGNCVQIAAQSGVMTDIEDNLQIGGAPARNLQDTKRVVLQTQRLPELASRVKKLERELKALKSQLEDDA